MARRRHCGPIRQRSHAAFFRDHAGVPLRRRRAEPAKFLAVKDYTFIADDITEDHRAGEMADGQTIARRSIVQMIGGDELPGAWHVLHDNARIAGQMFADVARHHAAVGIESPRRQRCRRAPRRFSL